MEPLDTAPSLECLLEVIDGDLDLAVISRKLWALDVPPRPRGVSRYGTGRRHRLPATRRAIGCHGLLITPGEGVRLRINTSYTNIANLPLASRNGQLWVRDFCSRCRNCVRRCPPRAIFQEPQPRGRRRDAVHRPRRLP